MSVESWNPASVDTTVTRALVDQLVAAAGRLQEDRFGLTAQQLARLAPFARHGRKPGEVDWSAAPDLTDAELVALVRLFTLAETQLPGWEAGARSPVIPLAAELRRRGAMHDDLTRWIKANSDNRFLPYGSLLDRL